MLGGMTLDRIGDVYLISGRPNAGKTTTAVELASRIRDMTKKDITFVSVEQSLLSMCETIQGLGIDTTGMHVVSSEMGYAEVLAAHVRDNKADGILVLDYNTLDEWWQVQDIIYSYVKDIDLVVIMTSAKMTDKEDWKLYIHTSHYEYIEI